MLMANKFTDLDRMHRQEQRRTPSAAKAKAGDGLTAVYDEIGSTDSLSLDQVPDGERRILIEKDVMMFVEKLHRPVKKNLLNHTKCMNRDRPDGLIPAHAFFLSIANRNAEKASLDF